MIFCGTLRSDGHISFLFSFASLLFSAICKSSSDNHFALNCNFPDTDHASVSELSACKGSVDVETAIGVKTDSPETHVREADVMRGM